MLKFFGLDVSLRREGELCRPIQLQIACLHYPASVDRPASYLTLLYDVFSIDARGTPSLPSLWSCHVSDSPWGPRWCLESLHPVDVPASMPWTRRFARSVRVTACPPSSVPGSRFVARPCWSPTPSVGHAAHGPASAARRWRRSPGCFAPARCPGMRSWRRVGGACCVTPVCTLGAS